MSDRALTTLYSLRCLTEPWSHYTVLDKCPTEPWSHYTVLDVWHSHDLTLVLDVRQSHDHTIQVLDVSDRLTITNSVWQTHSHKLCLKDSQSQTNSVWQTHSHKQTQSDRLAITNSPTLGRRFPLAHGDFDQASPWQQHQHQVMCKSYGTATDLQAERDDNKPIWDRTKLKQSGIVSKMWGK